MRSRLRNGRRSDGRPRVLVLLGAGRGGTTLLYKLLALHPQAAFLSNYEARFPRRRLSSVPQRWLRPRIDLKLRTWFQVGGGAYFDRPRSRLHALVPAPVEAEPLYAACGIPLEPSAGQPVDGTACAKLRKAFADVQDASGAQLVLTKRTSNNRRVNWLEAAFDEPRYVHLMRDGRAVALSLTRVAWWPDHHLFWADCTPGEMAAQGRSPLAIAAENWSREIQGVGHALQRVDPRRVLTIRYEELLARPQAELPRILDFAGLRADLSAYWSAIGRLGLKPPSGGAAGSLSAEERQLVECIAGDALRQFGYAT